jgi:hypothetical protein
MGTAPCMTLIIWRAPCWKRARGQCLCSPSISSLIVYFDSRSDHASAAVNLIANIGDLARENLIAVCVDRSIHLVTCFQGSEVIFDDISNDAHTFEINDHEWRRGRYGRSLLRSRDHA